MYKSKVLMIFKSHFVKQKQEVATPLFCFALTQFDHHFFNLTFFNRCIKKIAQSGGSWKQSYQSTNRIQGQMSSTYKNKKFYKCCNKHLILIKTEPIEDNCSELQNSLNRKFQQLLQVNCPNLISKMQKSWQNFKACKSK